MRTVDGRWVDVKPNDYVKDQNGKWWKILAWDHVQATLVDADGKQAKARPGAYEPVTRMERTMSDAVKVVESVLGGTVIEERITER